MTRLAILAALLAACWTRPQPNDPKASASTDVRVELAAVTLADDCGDSGFIRPPVVESKAIRRVPSVAASAPAGDCAVGGCSMPKQQCEQTSMQLSLRAGSGTQPTTVRVKRVELLDDRGNVLSKLEARTPTRWTDAGGYAAWDQTIAPDQTLATSYSLTAPDWDTLTNGRWNAHTKKFQLRVTLAIGDHERAVEKQSITAAMLEPPVVT